MLFPNIENLATKQVVAVEASASARTALRRMVEENLRDVVVRTGNGEYRLLTASDLIRICIDGQGLEQPVVEVACHRLPVARPGTNVLDVLNYFAPEDEYICVEDGEHQLQGIVSYTNIATSIDPQVMIERQSVGDILVKNTIRTADRGLSLGQALVNLENPSDAVVLLEGQVPVGILTTKDAVRLLNSGVSFLDPVYQHMSSPLQTVPPEMTIKDAVEYLREKHFKRLVVEDDKGLLGVVTQRELIVVAYSHWADMLRSHTLELHEIVSLLERKTARLELLAATDRLTGVANRGRFEEALELELQRRERYDSGPLSVLMFDVDHFKEVNDRFGHLKGDEVLRQIARLASGSMRATDVFARWGGEEFVALMPHTRLEDAGLFAERLRESLANTSIPGLDRVCVSIGVAGHRKGETIEELMRRVDRALYQAKRDGRNRVVLAQQTEG